MRFGVRPVEFATRGLTLRGTALRTGRQRTICHHSSAPRLRGTANRGITPLCATSALASASEGIAVVVMDRAGHGE